MSYQLGIDGNFARGNGIPRERVCLGWARVCACALRAIVEKYNMKNVLRASVILYAVYSIGFVY